MKPFELTEDLQTGIDDIDNQHRKLLSWANFLAADDADTTVQKVTETLDNLQDYVAYHFQTEEQAMDKYGYDKLDKHRKQHHRLLNEVTDLFSRSRGKEASKGTLVELQYMLTDWIQLHIKEWDQPFAAFLKSKNIPSSVSLTE
ncbi:MAG: hemerythrin family protein [Proteobacteria bacterium]|nr:hemerythrin family protein [Pseudomonadota bacterium]